MNFPLKTEQLAAEILERSKCSVQVGAAIEDSNGIFSWGWNSEGFDGLGLHAEAHAIMRANKKRLRYATIYVASTRHRTGKAVISKPCAACQKLIDKWQMRAVWRDVSGLWRV